MSHCLGILCLSDCHQSVCMLVSMLYQSVFIASKTLHLWLKKIEDTTSVVSLSVSTMIEVDVVAVHED